MCDNKWRIKVTSFAERSQNPIRDWLESLRLVPHSEKQLISLSIGDPTTFGNLRPPVEAVEAVKRSLVSGSCNGYPPSAGMISAREAVAAYASTQGLKVTAQDVIIASGCSSALDLCISVLAGPGSNILVPRPGFPLYKTLAEGHGVTIRYYDLIPERGWEADLQQMERQIDKNTACIVINNPNNPCGSVYSAKHLKSLVNVAYRHYLPIIADEIYENLVFPGSEFFSIASLSKDVPILSCSGLTKRYLVPGWRLGWIVIHDRHSAFTDVRLQLNKLTQRTMGANSLVQGALPELLQTTPESFFSGLISILHKHAMLLHSRLYKIPGLRPVMPQGAMYIMVGIDVSAFHDLPNTRVFVERLISEESVFCLSGDCFQSPDFVRMVLTVPEDILLEACDRIERFCYRHYSKGLIKCEITAQSG